MEFTDSEFRGGIVTVDGVKFKGCRFVGAALVYSGGPPPTFEHCSFDSTNWLFEGGAGNTLEFLRGMYPSGFRPVVDGVIAYISGQTPPAEPKE